MQKLVDKYKLIPHPEGGYYREVFRSGLKVSSAAAGAERHAATHIYYLLTRGDISRFHRVLHDEIWNFYEGDPLRLIKYDGETIREERIGGAGDGFVCIMEAGIYQAAETTGEFSLIGCTVAPGFDFRDFSFLSDDKSASERIKTRHPEYARFIG